MSGSTSLGDDIEAHVCGALAPRIAALVEGQIFPAWGGVHTGVRDGLSDPVGSIGRAKAAPAATLRAQAQRIDAMAEASLSGLSSASAPRAAYLLAQTLRQFLAADGEAGFPRAVDVEGVVIDPVRDFESHAWLLRAVAKVHALTGSEETLLVADLILDFMDAEFGHAVAGYRPDSTGGRLGGQRGHLRLLEGLLTLHGAGGRARDFKRASALVELFRFHMIDRAAGAVGEYFDRDWRVVLCLWQKLDRTGP